MRVSIVDEWEFALCVRRRSIVIGVTCAISCTPPGNECHHGFVRPIRWVVGEFCTVWHAHRAHIVAEGDLSVQGHHGKVRAVCFILDPTGTDPKKGTCPIC